MDSIVRIAPEVFETLKALAPTYLSVFGESFNPYSERNMAWFCTAPDTGCNFKDRDGKFHADSLLYEITRDPKYSTIDKSDLTANDRIKILDFFELRSGYQALIERFGLDTDWLRDDLFRHLSNIVRYPNHIESLGTAYSHSECVGSGDPFYFEFDGWEIRRDSKEYAANVRLAFKKQLQNHISRTTAKFQADGYVRFRTRDFKRVDWLVIWNLSTVENIWEIIQQIPEFEKVDPANEKQRDSTVGKLRKAFAEFEKYDLPVRRWKMKVEN